jgi:hypothetical protein
MSPISVGSVSVDVVPNASRFAEQLRASIVPQAGTLGEEIGRQIADRIAESIRNGIQNGLRGGNPGVQGGQAGNAYGDEFSRVVKTKIEAALRSLPEVQIGVATSEAEQKLRDLHARLETLRNQTIGVDINATDALAEIEAIKLQLDELAHKSPDIAVRVDAAKAVAELAAVRAEVDKLDNKHADVKVDSSAASAGISGLVAVIATIGPALIPIAAVAAAGLGSIATVAVAGAAGVGVLALALHGVSAAVTAVNAEQASAATDAKAYATAQVSAAAAVEGAQASLGNAIRSAHNSAISSAEAVTAAQKALEDATRSAALSVTNAMQAEDTAEQSLTQALQVEQQAQDALTAARKTAQQQIEDLTLSVQDGALAQRGANLAVETSKIALDKALSNPASTRLQREQAQLTYDQALQHNKDLGVQQDRLRVKQADAVQAGVDGSAVVITAQDRVATSVLGVDKAQDAVAKSIAAVAEAQRSGVEKIDNAQQHLADTQRAQDQQAQSATAAVAAAQRALETAERAQQTAADSVSSSAQAANKALAALTPAGREFVTFITGTMQPAMRGLQATAASGLLPGLQSGLAALIPIIPVVNEAVGKLAKAMGDLFSAAGKALDTPFYRQFITFIGDEGSKVLTTFGQTIGNLVTGFSGLMMAFAPFTDAIGRGLLSLSKKFADFATNTDPNSPLQKFIVYIKENGPTVVDTFKQIGIFVGHVVEALSGYGGGVLKAIDATLKFLNKFSPAELATTLAGAATLFAVINPGFSSITLAVALAAAAIYNFYETNKPFKDYVDNVLRPALGRFGDNYRDVTKTIDDQNRALDDNSKAAGKSTTSLSDFGKFLTEKVLPALGTALGVFVETTKASWQGILTVFGQIGEGFKGTYNFIVTYFHMMGEKWDTLSHWMGDVYAFLGTRVEDVSNRLKGFWADLGQALTGLKDQFNWFVNGAGQIWDKMKELTAKPINFVINTILNDGLIKGFNAVTGIIGIPAVPPIPAIPGYAAGTKQIGDGFRTNGPQAVVGEGNQCIAYGTAIETADGPTSIEAITPGQRVATRNGYRLVLWSGLTRPNAEVLRVRTTNGEQVVCTPDHRIWATKGPTDGYRSGDRLGCGPVRGRRLFFRHDHEVGQPNSLDESWNDRPRHGGALPVNRRLVTSSRTVGSRAGAETYVQRGRGRASQCATVDSRVPAMAGGTEVAARRGTTGGYRESRRGYRVPTGVLQARASVDGGQCLHSAERDTCVPSVQAGPWPQLDATEARDQFSVSRTGESDRTRARASEACIEEGRWIEAGDLAPGDSVWTSGSDGELRPVRVVDINTAKRIDTYDLTVEGDHEFIAGGILVHNSFPEYVIPTDPKYRSRASDLLGSLIGEIGLPQLAGGGLLWPYPGPPTLQTGRTDDGWDMQGPPGGPILAVAPGTMFAGGNDPGGFGTDYPVEHLDKVFSIGGQDFSDIYYGHTHIARSGHVNAGDLVAHTGGGAYPQGGDGYLGEVEIGFGDPTRGTTSGAYGQLMKDALGGGGLTGSATASGGGIVGLLRDIVGSMFDAIVNPIGALVGSAFPAPPPVINGIPKAFFDTEKDTVRNFITGAADGKSAHSGTGSVDTGPGSPYDIFWRTAGQFGWDQGAQRAALNSLEMQEAGYNPLAQNPTSTAFGMGQFLDSTWESYGPKTSDPALQSLYMDRYIKDRYGDPIGARAHEDQFNWYDDGGWLKPGDVGFNTTGKPEPVFSDSQWAVLKGNLNTTGGGGATFIGVKAEQVHVTDLAELERRQIQGQRMAAVRAGV